MAALSLTHGLPTSPPTPARPEAPPPALPSIALQPSARDSALVGRLRVSLPSSAAAAAAAVGGVPPGPDAGHAAMGAYVAALFAPYKHGGNDAVIDQLAASRARDLHDSGETVPKLLSLFD